MQTLILTNPVVGQPRPEVALSDNSTAELSSEAFADFLAKVPGEQLPADRTGFWTGPLSVPLPLAASSEGVSFVRPEPIGAVQGLAEAAMTAIDRKDDGPLTPQMPSTKELEVASGVPVAEVVLLLADPISWVSAALDSFSLPTPLSQVATQSALDHPGHVIPNRDTSGGNQLPDPGASLPPLLLVDDDTATIDPLALPIVRSMARSEIPGLQGLGMPERPSSRGPKSEGMATYISGSEWHRESNVDVLQSPEKATLSATDPIVAKQDSATFGSPAAGLQQLVGDEAFVPVGNQSGLQKSPGFAPSNPDVSKQESATFGSPAAGLQQHAWDEALVPVGNQSGLQKSLLLGPSSLDVAKQESAALGSPGVGLQQRAWDEALVPVGNQSGLQKSLGLAPSGLDIAPILASLPTVLTQSGAELPNVPVSSLTENTKGLALSQIAVLPGPVFVASASTGATVFWLAGLTYEAGQNLPADLENVDAPDPSSPPTSNPAAALLHNEGKVAPTLRFAADLTFSPLVLVQPDDPDPDAIATVVAPGFGLSQTLGATASTGYLAASLGPQDLHRLTSQLVGTLVQSANGQTEVALSPEELGHVRLSMQADSLNPERMVVMLSFERPETLDLFRRHADLLADALREAGYSEADISFGRSGREDAHDRSEPDRPASAPPDAAGDTDSTPTHRPPRIAATGSLDLRL